MSYPSLEQYNYAMQHPNHVLTDPELKRGTIAVNGLGLPRTISGGFALTYTITTGATKYAVRCFHKQSNHLEKRYEAISAKLDALHSSYFVKFEFQPQGVVVEGSKFPVVKMAWASGKTLGEFMGASYRNKNHLQELNKSLLSLSAYLEKQRMAHGDIQPGNIMVANEGRTVQLIDYDGMFVEDIENLGGTELGLRNFQHPGRTGMIWDWQIDRFSFILLNLVTRALEIYPDLWNKTQSDEIGFLFRAQDFADPENSDVFRQLFDDPKLKDDAKNFASVCKAPYEKIPSPEDFLAKRNIPQVAISISPAGKITQTAYMGAYPVVDATDYALCLRRVGDLVELVGQITDIKEDFTRYGTPYVFLNFGNWKGEISKIVIWSEALSTFAKHPDSSWIGRWISVTGLLEPPFQRRSYSHIAITITQANQIHEISEKEANYRLLGEEAPAPKVKASPKNKEILDGIMGTGTAASSLNIPTSRSSTVSQSRGTGAQAAKPVSSTPQITSASKPSATASPLTKNQSVIQNMKSGQSVVVASQNPTAKSQQLKAQPAPSQQPTSKPAKTKTVIQQKKAVSPWLALGVLLFIPLGIAAFFLPMLLNLPQRIENVQATPTRKPVATATKLAQLPVAATTEAPECTPWNEITTASKGEILCIYGEVTSSRDFIDATNNYSLVRFSDDQRSFYLIAYDGTLVYVSIGDCLRTEALVQIDPNGVPFMEPSEISRNKVSCTK